MLKRNIFAVVLLAAIIFINPTASFACPGCNAALTDQLGRAFNPSVLFMMAMPFAVAGAIAGGLFYAHWRAQKKTIRQVHEANEATPQKRE
ncbi:MAG: hypothetical protein ONB46_14265 [candidate division KSB1 bacterium]|nr:hypothetical protein [candidate division KSB1 bacterium]MDZ7366896.1 hypothetical protein [candidate division KSB1 bacterium]MDZ7406065.1 hypothetical protein [candidate division KSB1 bacterium]